MSKPNCSRCKKVISGNIKVDTKRTKLGNKRKHETLYYCEECFERLNIERSWNEHNTKKSKCKKKNC